MQPDQARWGGFTTATAIYPASSSPEDNLAANVANLLQQQTSYGMGIDPVGLHVMLRQMWERYHLPLLITENGCGVPDELVSVDKLANNSNCYHKH